MNNKYSGDIVLDSFLKVYIRGAVINLGTVLMKEIGNDCWYPWNNITNPTYLPPNDFLIGHQFLCFARTIISSTYVLATYVAKYNGFIPFIYVHRHDDAPAAIGIVFTSVLKFHRTELDSAI